jgi:hypothetical protein
MPGAIVKRIVGEIAQSKTKGDAYKKEIGSKLSPEAIANKTDKK